MKKTYLLLLFSVFIFAACSDDDNETNGGDPGETFIELSSFTDVTFRTYCADNFDKNKDDKLSKSEIDAVTNIDISELTGIRNVKGIEAFTNLKRFISENNYYIESLDFSSNTKLTYFKGSHINDLSVFNISKNTAIDTLDISWLNKLGKIDLSNNVNLVYLAVEHAGINSLDVSKLTKLKYFNCNYNKLGTIDITKNTALLYFSCQDNALVTLNLDNNTALTTLNCSHNGIGEVLDIRYNKNLKNFFCNDNSILKHLFAWKGFDKSKFERVNIPENVNIEEY